VSAIESIAFDRYIKSRARRAPGSEDGMTAADQDKLKESPFKDGTGGEF
jgi:hypothetical protein